MCGHQSVFVRPFPPMVMSYSQGEPAAPQAWMAQVKGMLHVTTRGTPPLPRPGFPHACSSEGTAVLPPSCFPPIPAEPRCVGGGGGGVEFGRRLLPKTTSKLQDPWSPHSGPVSVTFPSNGLSGCSKVTGQSSE